MNLLYHWLCSPGDSVAADYFQPPIPQIGEPVLEVLAFHSSFPKGQKFVRAGLGESWIYTP